MSLGEPRINGARPCKDIYLLACIGRHEIYGIYRMDFSAGDMVTHDSLCQRTGRSGFDFHEPVAPIHNTCFLFGY